MATIAIDDVHVEMLGAGFLQPIERGAVRWLARRRSDAGTWHRNWNKQLSVKRRSNELFDFEVRAIHTDGPNTVMIGGRARPFVEDACAEFAAMGLIPQAPASVDAAAVFAQVVNRAINDGELQQLGAR